jgi:hypothetical protein
MSDPTGPMPGGAESNRLVGHCYTKARRFPLVIGKLPGGGRIPGGPYSLHQIGAMVLAAIVLKQTSAIWAHFGWRSRCGTPASTGEVRSGRRSAGSASFPHPVVGGCAADRFAQYELAGRPAASGSGRSRRICAGHRRG